MIIMNRKLFISKFNEHFKENENNFFNFSIETKDFSSDLEFKEKIYELFMPFFKKIGIKNKFSILEKIENNKTYDDYYEEDNQNSEFCSFKCKININHLYDVIKKVENYSQNNVEIFRIENKKNNGLYNTFFAGIDVDENSHPDPNKDVSFAGIFDLKNSDYKYSQKWSFGFNSLKEIKDWLITEENQSKLEKSECFIKKITIEEDYVIEGHKQLIFKLEKKISEEIIAWKELNKYIKKQKKF